MSTRILSVTPEHLDALRRKGPVTLVDVRTPTEYRAGHAAGARLVPLDELDPTTLVESLGDPALGRETTLYLTCQSGARASQAAARLAEAGYRNLAVLSGGTDAWQRAGLPMRRCSGAIALERQVQITVGLLLVLKVVFGFTVHELFFVAVAFLGAGLVVAGATRCCGLARLLALMPWNRAGDCADEAPA
jgi:rhodanese-related sulfurtransferase